MFASRLCAPTILACLLAIPSCLGLEGGSTSDGRHWSKSITHEMPHAEERAKEVAARQAAIQADITRLQHRLTKVPAAAQMSALHDRLNKIIKERGWVSELQMVFGIRDIKPMLNNRDKLNDNFLKCMIQLRDDLAKRKIDLIFMPLAASPSIYAHELVDGIDASHEYHPGWTKMLLEFLKADIEIIDPIEEMRAHSKDDLIINWPNDFHTASGGRLLAAKALAKRLQRYGFIRDLQPHVDSWKLTETTAKCSKSRIGVINGRYAKNSTAHDFKNLLKDRSFTILQVEAPKGSKNTPVPDLRRSDLVFIGDSQLHSSVYGSGWPEIAMSQIGGRFRWGSQSGGISHSLNEIYLQVVPDYAVQPRVVVVTSLTKYFWDDDIKAPRRLPDHGELSAHGVPIQPFECTVKLTKISKRPTEDANSLDYREALFHAAAICVDGPMAGKEIGLRYVALWKGSWSGRHKLHGVGKTFNLRLHHWPLYLKHGGPSAPGRARWQVFDDCNQDLLIPLFMVTSGALAGNR